MGSEKICRLGKWQSIGTSTNLLLQTCYRKHGFFPITGNTAFPHIPLKKSALCSYRRLQHFNDCCPHYSQQGV